MTELEKTLCFVRRITRLMNARTAVQRQLDAEEEDEEEDEEEEPFSRTNPFGERE